MINALIGGNLLFSRGIQLPEGIEQRNINLTRAEHQLHMNWHNNAASLWRHE